MMHKTMAYPYMEEAPDPKYTHRENEVLEYSSRPMLVPDSTLAQSNTNKPADTGVVFRQPL